MTLTPGIRLLHTERHTSLQNANLFKSNSVEKISSKSHHGWWCMYVSMPGLLLEQHGKGKFLNYATRDYKDLVCFICFSRNTRSKSSRKALMFQSWYYFMKIAIKDSWSKEHSTDAAGKISDVQSDGGFPLSSDIIQCSLLWERLVLDSAQDLVSLDVVYALSKLTADLRSRIM